jgi:hypothetical protein
VNPWQITRVSLSIQTLALDDRSRGAIAAPAAWFDRGEATAFRRTAAVAAAAHRPVLAESHIMTDLERGRWKSSSLPTPATSKVPEWIDKNGKWVPSSRFAMAAGAACLSFRQVCFEKIHLIPISTALRRKIVTRLLLAVSRDCHPFRRSYC